MKNSPLIETIIETISERILSGEYPGGYKLSENTISSEFSCSRTPVREALKRLEQNTLVEIKDRSGTYVKTFSDEENLKITEVRAYLESLAFRLALERGNDTSRLKQYLDEMERCLSLSIPDFAGYGRAHYAFHQEIVRLSDNKLLITLYESMHLNNSLALIYKKLDPEGISATMNEHTLIFNYLDTRDEVNGPAFMLTHLWSKRERLISDAGVINRK